MVVVVFRARARAGTEARLEQLEERMISLGSRMPGFLSYKVFGAADGEGVSIVEFETMEDCIRWRDHPDHRAVQEEGRGALFAEYSVQVCELVRATRGAHA